MEGALILSLLIWSFLFCGLPALILYELLLLITNQEEAPHPFILCISISSIISIILIVLMMRGATGEAGLAGIAITPLILISSLVCGFAIAYIYKIRNKPLLPRNWKIRFGILLCLLVAFLAICIHFEPAHKGKITDSDSGKPVSNVLVNQTLTYTCTFPLNPGGPNSEFMGYSEALSDDEGKYSIPFRIFLKPPLLCLSESGGLGFVKAGYFTSYSSPWEKKVVLKKANHLFDFNKTTHESYFSPQFYRDQTKRNSQLISTVLKEAEKLHPVPDGEAGVFLSSPGRQFTKLFHFYDDEEFEGRLFYAFDEKSETWFAFDKRGLPVEDKHTNNILGQVNDKLKYGEVSYIFFGPYSGSWSDNRGYIFTIEQGGDFVCEYKNGEFVECISREDLPQVSIDDSLSTTKFIAVEKSQGEGYDIFTKTDKYTHRYNLIYKRDKQEVTKEIHEIQSSLTDKDVKAIAGYKNTHLFGLSDGQIVWSTYNLREKQLNYKKFSRYIEDTGLETIESLLISFESGYPYPQRGFVYVTDGSDKIYRFASTGHYDFKVYITDMPLNNIIVKGAYSSQLFRTIRSKENVLVKKLLEAGSNPNVLDKNKNTPLFVATEKNNILATQLLLDHGADPNFANKEGLTPLRYSITPEVIELLLKNDADPTIKDSNDEPMLNFSRVYKHPGLIHTLLEKGLNINAVYKDGSTELHKCIDNYNFSCERTLLNQGADPNFKDSDGRTPLLKAIKKKPNGAKLLLKFGANPNIKDSSGNYPIWLAAEQFNYKLIRLLLNKGADAKIRNDNGQTLFWALFARSNVLKRQISKIYLEETSKILLGKGVQLSTKDNNGQTILNWAEETGQHGKASFIKELIANEEEIRKKYLSESQRVNKAESTSTTPKKLSDHEKIILFVKQGDEESMRTLFGNIKQRDKNYALWMAVTHRKPSIAEFLLKSGTDPNDVNKHGQSCLWRAADNADVEIISLLLRYGANINLRDKYGRTALWELAAGRTHSNRLMNIKSLSGVVVEGDGGVGKGFTYNIGDLINKSLEQEIAAAQLLIDNGLAPAVQDNEGKTAYEIAIENQNESMVEFLSKYIK